MGKIPPQAMGDSQIIRFRTISEYHQHKGLPGPEHPLISLVPYEQIKPMGDGGPLSYMFDFYSISLKRNTEARMRYGQQEYDFNSGVLFFM